MKFLNGSMLTFTILLLLLVHSTYSTQAQQLPENILHRLAELPVDARIIALLEQSKTEPIIAREILVRVELTSATFNAAENYLMLMIKANLAVAPDRDEKIIALLLQTESLVKKIDLPQLNSSPFIQSSLMLAESYAARQQFQKAYLHKKNYIDRFWESKSLQRNNKIEVIDEKYETNRKSSENELLANQSKLKKLQLKSVEDKKSVQLRNIIILLLTGFLFSLILFRQLSLKKSLRQATQMDLLTQLPNRKILYKKGQQLINVISGNNKNMALAVINIDDFSEINDQYGYKVGDLVLQTVAQLGRETMRTRDMFARSGDAEFSAILAEATLGEAKAISERLREKIASITPESLGINKPLSISVGIASRQQAPGGFEQLVKAAIKAMYDAQNNGKNQVLIYQDD
ncbi:MAG: GGDEF domain-containing protein [Colwellia sp.]|nr:GGDEF domain-containing protein [Colwellia sp.]